SLAALFFCPTDAASVLANRLANRFRGFPGVERFTLTSTHLFHHVVLITGAQELLEILTRMAPRIREPAERALHRKRVVPAHVVCARLLEQHERRVLAALTKHVDFGCL